MQARPLVGYAAFPPGAPMRMTHSHMYARFAAGDAAWNGRFFTGVLTTGIYCLPSCKARKAKSENVRFFPSCEEARAAGLRPCLKCHPDDFARGSRPRPGDDRGPRRGGPRPSRQVPGRRDRSCGARDSGRPAASSFSASISTPRPPTCSSGQRSTAARRLLVGADSPLTDVAHEAGFESISVFHEHFRTLNGMTPSDYRALRTPGPFQVDLPKGFPLAHLLRTLGRDPHSVTERLTGETYETAADLAGVPAVVRVRFSGGKAAVTAEAVDTLGVERRVAAHRQVIGMLGLDQDAGAFARLARRLGLARLVAGRPGLRLTRTSSVLEGLLWCIIGQQINLPFACVLRRRLIENLGTPLPGGLFSLPAPGRIAAMEPADLRPWQYSQEKGGVSDRRREARRRGQARPRRVARDVGDPGGAHAAGGARAWDPGPSTTS